MLTAFTALAILFVLLCIGGFFLARRKFIPLALLKLGLWTAMAVVVAMEVWVLVLLLTR